MILVPALFYTFDYTINLGQVLMGVGMLVSVVIFVLAIKFGLEMLSAKLEFNTTLLKTQFESSTNLLKVDLNALKEHNSAQHASNQAALGGLTKAVDESKASTQNVVTEVHNIALRVTKLEVISDQSHRKA